MTDGKSTAPLPLSFTAEQMVAGMVRRLKEGEGEEFGLHNAVLDLLEHQRAVAEDAESELDLEAVETAARRQVNAGDAGRPIDHDWLVARANSAAAAAGRSVIAPVDLATPLLRAAGPALVGQEDVQAEPEAEPEEVAPPAALPLGFLAEQLLAALDREVGRAAEGGGGPSSWLLALSQGHRDLAADAAEGTIGDLEAAARRRVEAGASELPLGREEIVTPASEHAREAGRSVVTPADLAETIVDLVQRESEPPAAEAPETAAEPRETAVTPPEPEAEAEPVRPELDEEPEPVKPVEPVEPAEPAKPFKAARTFRVFVSSTFSDLKAERDALQAYVFPRLRELCEKHGARFQAIDLRWGVSEEASRDQQTMNICLGEIERCQEVTPRPNFIVLLGDRYGWCPPPSQIAEDEFEELRPGLTDDRIDLLLFEEKRHQLSSGSQMVWDPDEEAYLGPPGWYRLDENAVPAEYQLRPRRVDLSGCETREEKEKARKAESDAWGKIEPRIQQALEDAAEASSLPKKQRLKYEASATHQEIAAGALQVENPERKVFCFFRSLSDLPDPIRPQAFLSLVERRWQEQDRVLSSEAQACLRSIRDLSGDAPPRAIHDLIADAEEEVPEGSDAAEDLELLDTWLRASIAFDYRDLDDDWLPDEDAEGRLDELKDDLRSRVPDNVHGYDKQWTEEGPTTDRIGTLPEDLDACLALLEREEPPETLCARVWRRLATTIRSEIEDPSELPAGPQEIHLEPDQGLDAEGRSHCDFANGLLKHFVGRDNPLSAIRADLDGDDPRTLAVVAEGGAGKSALMAKALEAAQAGHPQAQVVYRFVGATPSSSDGRSLLVSLCQEISRRYGQDEDVPYDYTDLVPELVKRMNLATRKQPLILFIDALDQLSEAHGARRLTWLPRRLPEHVRLVVSTRREEDTFDAVMQHQPEEVELEAMSRQDGAELLRLWLKDAGRTDDTGRELTNEQTKAVLDAFQHEVSAGRPLYLKLAFEEARLWPSYGPPEDLEPGIEGVIRKNLFHRLSRERNHGEELVARTVGYLAASRYGLAEDELVDVLSRDVDLYTAFLKRSFHVPSDLIARAVAYRASPDSGSGADQGEEQKSPAKWLVKLIEDPSRVDELRQFLEKVLPTAGGPRLPVILWSRLYFDLEPYLTRRSSEGIPLLSFYHRELEDVGKQAYADGEEGRVLHGRLADYFESRADPKRDGSWDGGNARGLSELPYHLTEAARWEEVFETLIDFEFLEHKAAEVGVERSEVDSDGKGEVVYTGVLQLQEDYDRALRKMPGGRAAGGRRPLIVTAVDLGDGLVVRCPWCNAQHPLTEERREEWLGEEIACPNEDCEGPLKVNPFAVEREHGNGR
jgi:hypothetical protein